MRKKKQMGNFGPFNDWMNDFEITQTNEWQKKILRKFQIKIQRISQSINIEQKPWLKNSFIEPKLVG